MLPSYLLFLGALFCVAGAVLPTFSPSNPRPTLARIALVVGLLLMVAAMAVALTDPDVFATKRS